MFEQSSAYAKRATVGSLALIVGLAGCVHFASTKVEDSVIASCVSKGGFPQGTQINVERAFKTDGMDARVRPSIDIDATAARSINACIETAVMGKSVKYSSSGVSQKVETAPDGNSKRVTYTYGSMPKTAAPVVAGTTATSQPPVVTGHRACRNTMVGGDGYACMPI